MFGQFKFNLIQLINSRNNQLFYIAFLSCLALMGFLLGLSDRLSLSKSAISSGDVPSYLLFPFFPFEEAFSSHRTLGFPLALQSFQQLDSDLSLLPVFLYVLYGSSLIFLFSSLINAGFKPIIAFLLSLSLLVNASFISGLNSLAAATQVSILMVFILGMLFRFDGKRNPLKLSILSILIFLLYQTRPNMAPVIILAPLWLFAINFFTKKRNFKSSSKISLLSLSVNFIPLILFLFFRFISVGEIGMNSFSGTILSGQATSYLDEKTITNMEGTPKILANKILERKRQISYPCSKEKNDLTNEERHWCGNIFLMVAWLETIKYFDKQEPFNESELNLEPWLHGNLSTFFSRNNLIIDNSLKDYSYQIIKLEPSLAFSRMLYEYRFALEYLFAQLFGDLIYVACLIFLSFSWIIRSIILKNLNLLSISELKESKEFYLFLIISFVALTYMLQGVLVTGALLHLDYRYISSALIFFPSVLLLFSALPYLTKET